MSTVNVDELTHILALSRAFTNNCTHVLEQMLLEELVEFLGWALNVLVQFGCETLAEYQCIGERAIISRCVSQEHEQECVEGCELVSGLVKGKDDVFNIKLKLFNEVECKMIGQLVNTREEGKNEVVFNLNLSEFSIVSFTAHEISDLLLEDIDNSLVWHGSSFLV